MDTAKLFQNGQSQAVRLPKAYRLAGEEVYIKKVGNAVVLLPLEHPWGSLFESLAQFSEDFLEERAQPTLQVREKTFKTVSPGQCSSKLWSTFCWRLWAPAPP